MRYQLLTALVLPFLVACGEKNTQPQSSDRSISENEKTFTSESDAKSLSPTGDVCLVSGEIKTTTECIPDNRGKNGKCTDTEVTTDTRIWEPAYLRGDVDFDGVSFTRDDAQLATKRIYVKQIDSQPCPAVADIAPFEGIHDQYQADGYLTSNDINKWGDIKRGDNPGDMGVVCLSQCAVINHMSPEYK